MYMKRELEEEEEEEEEDYGGGGRRRRTLDRGGVATLIRLIVKDCVGSRPTGLSFMKISIQSIFQSKPVCFTDFSCAS